MNAQCLNSSAPAGTSTMLAVVVILAVCGYCSAQCSTTPPAGLTVPTILTLPVYASSNSKCFIVCQL